MTEHEIPGTAETPAPSTVPATSAVTEDGSRRHPRRLVRILCDLAAVVCVLAAILFGFNAAVSNGFNSTAATLRENQKIYSKIVKGSTDTELDTLVSSQKQVNAQLSEARASTSVQLPKVRSALTAATSASAKLDEQIKKLQGSPNGAESQGASVDGTPSSNDSSGSSGDNSSDNGSSDADKKAEQKKLDALLKQNTSSNQGDDDSSTTSPDTSTTKPW
jgi:hypothetical protein